MVFKTIYNHLLAVSRFIFGPDPSSKCYMLLEDVHWHVLSSPEEAELTGEGQEHKPLPDFRRLEVIFDEEIQLELEDRYNYKRARIPVQGTLDQVLKTIHQHYRKMHEKYTQTHGDDEFMPGLLYCEEDSEKFGWCMEGGLHFQGIERDGENWTLEVSSLA